ncbi:GntR family transcriptional regulator [Kitasatospora sp. NBC_01266]|uniref:GntR family transcriptional regulator n=1 Tax=Kitasatospora sp. NBC_01266 TaxID=2903572 RepID=UPI002E2F6D3F|nr:GntR family transcriptional regulator [Kitasatospora sp. NBC_01266]
MAVRPQALYKQVAQDMRKKIIRGTWKPGAQIPTEDKLTAQFGVSRPTVRQAVAELRTEGLLDVQQGRGTFVRGLAPDRAEPVWIDRTVSRTGERYECTGDWSNEEDPTIYRVRVDATAAEILHIEEGEAAYLVDRLIIHQPSGTRARYTTLLPMEAITSTPIAQDPAIPTAEAYTHLAAAHGPLQFREAVSARMPNPDERAVLQLPDSVPVLISQRVTQTEPDGNRLILETTTIGAGATHVIFTHRPADQ